MQVVLKPMSHPQWGEIVIKDSLFAVGRQEAPFEAYQEGAVTKLSRRHARIFQEKGVVYVVDMGSRNGTKLNGRPVKEKPTRLKRGDELQFAEELTYRVEIDSGDETVVGFEQTSPQIALTLTPKRKDSGIDPIIITQFPFLVSKADSVFAAFKDRYPHDVNYISRRHAHIFLKQDEIYIEDLGSTNGTFLSGDRLDEHAKRLNNDDLISFGGDRFSYIVSIDRGQEKREQEVFEDATRVDNAISAKPQAEKPQAAPGEAKTTFVATATSFLDIFCVEEDTKDSDAQSSDQNDSAADAAQKRVKRERGGPSGKEARAGFFQKLSTFLGEFRQAFGEEKPSKSYRGWIIAGIASLIIAVAVGVYFAGTDKRDIKRLLTDGQYEQSVTLANQYLKEHPGDEQVTALATEGLLKLVVPSWESALAKQQFSEANKLLEQAEDYSTYSPEGLEILEFMGWIARLEEFVTERGGLKAPIAIYKHEGPMQALVEHWEAYKTRYQRLTSRILAHLPSFKEIHANAISHLRTIRDENSLYLKAINRLKKDIEMKLDENRAEDISVEIAKFEKKYPKITGLQELRGDLANYLTLQKATTEKNLTEMLRLRDSMNFQTPIFALRAENMMTSALPPKNIITEYQQAMEAWRTGEADQAIAILESLTQGAWGEVVADKKEHYQNVLRDFQALQEVRGKADYGDRILEFYGTLDPVGDIFFIDAIAADFRIHKGKALVKADEAAKVAKQQWFDYRKNGGIGGVARVENTISNNYREQAQRLMVAYDNVSRSAKIYYALELKYPTGLKQLSDKILEESKRQRKWLNDLKVVLEPSLLQAKLELLPQPKESEPWQKRTKSDQLFQWP